MRILVLGSSGILGNYLSHFLNKNFKVFTNGLKKRRIDLLNIIEVESLIKKIKPKIIINCAALTSIDTCEKDKKTAFNVNYKILKNTVDVLKKNKFESKIIQISTDQFYNNKLKKFNKENINCIPNYYCKTKKLAEQICIKNNLIVVRTNFFGKSNSKNNSFSDWIYKSFRSGEEFYLLNDVYFSPLNLLTLSKMIEKIIEKIDVTKGIFNIGSRDCISKKNFAIKFAKLCNIYRKNYQLIDAKSLFTTKRPRFMCMNTQKFEKHLKVKMPTIKSQISYEAKKYK